MSYSKTTWKTGDTITAQLLNHAEDGIAANDAAIAAIPAGLQLYGPYFAGGSITLEAGLRGPVVCNTMKDKNENSITYPNTTDAVVLVSAVDLTGALMIGYTGPVVVSVDSEDTWSYGTVFAYNDDAEPSSNVSATITFYSTVEFPQESQE